MPFTSHHLGAGLLVGFLLRRRINWFTFLLTTAVLVDLEPIYVVFFNPPGYRVHGYMHTFLASILAGFIVGLLAYSVRKLIEKHIEGLGLVEPGSGMTSYVLAGITGWGLHVFMDSFLYYDIQPFIPIECNPLYIPQHILLLHRVYEAVFYIGSVVYLVYLARHLAKRGFNKSRWLVTGLIATGLGFLNLLISLLSLAPLLAGFLLIAQGLANLVPLYKFKIRVSSALLITATVLLYATIPVNIGGYLDTYFLKLLGFEYSFCLFIVSYFCIALAVSLIYPVTRTLVERLKDKAVNLYTYMLLAGLLLVPLLIGIPMATIACVGIIIRITSNKRIEGS